MKTFKELLNDFYNNKLDIGIYTSKNDKDENMIIEISNEYLKTSTLQSNGWVRINIYYKDYSTEELYEK